MGNKRKFERPSAKKEEPPFCTKFALNETFDDSEDEFEKGRDQILLEEGPEAKRRRKLEEEGTWLTSKSIRDMSS
jgi:U3 small nucleolar RNA-associated protein 3